MSHYHLLKHSLTSHIVSRILRLGLYLLVAGFFVQAGPTNRTIDDEYGDSVTGEKPAYNETSNAGWNSGPPCSTCGLVPATDQLFMGTWHDTTLMPDAAGTNTISVNFTGTAVWVYCATAQKANSTSMITGTNLDIELDGEGQSYVYDPTDQDATTSDFNYNVTVYSKTGLANQQHTLVINLQPGSWIAFDWLEYTYEDVQPTLAPPIIPLTSTSLPTNSDSNSTSSTNSFAGTPRPSSSSGGSAVMAGMSSAKSSLTTGLTTILTTVAGSPTTVVSSVRVTYSPSAGASLNSTGDTSSTSPERSHPSTAVIVGAVVGGAVGLTLLSLILCVYRRYRRKSTEGDHDGLIQGDSVWVSERNPIVADDFFSSTSSLGVHCTEASSPTIGALETITQILERRSLRHNYSDEGPMIANKSTDTPDTSFDGTTTCALSTVHGSETNATVGSDSPHEGFTSSAMTGPVSEPPLAPRKAMQLPGAMSMQADIPRATSPSVSALQRQIGELQMRLAETLEIAERSSVDMKTPPPAYEEPDRSRT